MRANDAANFEIRELSVRDEGGDWPAACVYIAGRSSFGLQSDYEEARVLAKSLLSRLESIDECTLNATIEDLLAHVEVLAECLSRGRGQDD